jgi:hypothetical protein
LIKIETFDMGWSLSGPLTILCTNVLSLGTIDKTETFDRTFVHNIVSEPLKDHPISKVSVLSIVSKDRTFVHNIVSGHIVYECPVLRNN